MIRLYEEDFKKIDASGKRKSSRDEEIIYDLIDSCTVLPCYNSSDLQVSLSQTKDLDSYKLYLADTGLFITLMFLDRPEVENDRYAKLLSDKLPANLGYWYENLCELYYHTWSKEGSSHYYEIDFLIARGTKVDAIEVKSSGIGKHESLYAVSALVR